MDTYSHPNFAGFQGQGSRPEYTRSVALGAAVGYARSGYAVLPCRHAHDGEGPKAPVRDVATRGVYSASKEESRVMGMFKAAPAASIGVAGGRVSRLVVLDVDIKSGVDGLAELRRLEERHGELPRTWTDKTPSGGLRVIFSHHGDLPSSKGRLAPGIEVKAEGTYFLVSPSPGYERLVEAPPAPLPEWIEEAAKEPEPVGPRLSDEPSSTTLPDDEDLLGRARRARNGAKFGRLHNEGDVGGFPSHSEADFALVNLLIFWTGGERERIVRLFESSALHRPGGKHRSYVGRTVDSALRSYRGGFHEEPPGKREMRRRAEILGESWYGIERRGNKGAVRLARRLLSLIPTIGRDADGDVDVSVARRELAEDLGCHVNTVDNARRRLEAAGLLSFRHRRGSGESGTFTLFMPPPRENCDTHKSTASVNYQAVTKPSRPPAGELLTRHHANRGPIGYAGEDVLCFVEAHPGAGEVEISDLLGWTRPRDLRRLHLERLESEGQIECRDGAWYVVGGYGEAQRRMDETPYGTIQERCAREWSPRERRWVFFVAENGCIASQKRRREWAAEHHRSERKMFQRWLAGRKKAVERACGVEDHPAYIEVDGRFVNACTGEVVGWIGEPGEVA